MPRLVIPIYKASQSNAWHSFSYYPNPNIRFRVLTTTRPKMRSRLPHRCASEDRVENSVSGVGSDRF